MKTLPPAPCDPEVLADARQRSGAQPSALVLAEERERQLASRDDAALVRYLARWEQALCRLQRAHPQRWHVPGLSEEEVRDALTLRLFEAVRELAAPPGDEPAAAPAARPWGLGVMQRHLRVLRRAFRVGATLTDLQQAPVFERGPSQEERWLSHEADVCRAIALERAEQQLSQPQRRWFSALQSAADAGAFFRASERVNLSAAARLLDKDRSSAQRAYESLQACFQRELQRVE